MEKITSIADLNFKDKYTINVMSDDFEGRMHDEDTKFTNCGLESTGSSAEFSFDLEEDYEAYEDVPDENIVVVTQEDIDKGRVEILLQTT